MKAREIIILLLSVVLAIAVAVFTRKIFKADAGSPKTEMVQVLVAKKDLLVGSKIEQLDLMWADWPKNSLHPSYMTKAEQKDISKAVLGAVVRYAVAKNEPIRRDKIVQTDDKGLLAAVLAPGKMAFTINLGKRSNVSGLLQPGDYVDVIVAGRPLRGEKVAGKTVVSRVRVLATDGNLASHAVEKVVSPQEIVLEVTSQQAEELAASLKEGKPSISVHSLVNLKSAPTQEVEVEKPTSRVISVIRGRDRSKVSVSAIKGGGARNE